MRLRYLAVPLVAIILVAAALWVIPTDEYVFSPDRAKPLADRVQVEGARPAGAGDVYYVDVLVRKASLLEQLLPFTRPNGATLVPERALLPPGTSEEQRDRQNAADMQRSQQVASAVALRALGYDVRAVPRGALVVAVVTGMPAAGRLRSGDLIVAVDGRTVRSPSELRRAIATRSPGEEVQLTVRRDGKRIRVVVDTVPDPMERDRPIVGITVDQAATIELPLDVDIDLDRVGGPSAGLPFALEIVRMLGRDVTHGCNVAATGALALDGSVISVGGLKQKTLGARRADVDLFLVPAGDNAKDAQSNADGLRIVPVESFQQSLRILATEPVKC